MVHFIVKVAPSRDAYLVWSTEVQAPVQFGTRAELQAESPELTDERFERADTNGTSWSAFFWLPGSRQRLGWDDLEGVIVERRGFLPRSRIGDVYELLQADPEATIPDEWLDLFDDEDGDYRG